MRRVLKENAAAHLSPAYPFLRVVIDDLLVVLSIDGDCHVVEDERRDRLLRCGS